MVATMRSRRPIYNPAELRRLYGEPQLYGPGGDRDRHDDRIITPEHSERAIEHHRRTGLDMDTCIRATRRAENYALQPGYGPQPTTTASWGMAGSFPHGTETPIVAADCEAVAEYVRRYGCSWREGVEALSGAAIMEDDEPPPVKQGMAAAMRYVREHPGLSPEEAADVLKSA